MSTRRLEAFSDGVFAVIITIMVLGLHAPPTASLAALMPLFPVFLSYVLSFVFLAIYWNNHHHLLQASEQVSGPILWANMHLLFWLSLIPFTTDWVGSTAFSGVPIALYGVNLFVAGLAYYILSRALVTLHGEESRLAVSIGRDWKGITSLAIYAAAIGVSFANSLIAFGLYVVVAIMWIVPDPRIERVFPSESTASDE
jgi:TMEM175 potassium channel family protein